MKEIKIVLLGKTGQIGSVLGKKLKKNTIDQEKSKNLKLGKKLKKPKL